MAAKAQDIIDVFEIGHISDFIQMNPAKLQSCRAEGCIKLKCTVWKVGSYGIARTLRSLGEASHLDISRKNSWNNLIEFIRFLIVVKVFKKMLRDLIVEFIGQAKKLPIA